MSGSEVTLRADARRNRDAVLAAAAPLLAVQPDASMHDVAVASGLGRTTVYRHFPTRGDLIAALLGQVAEEAGRMCAAAVGEPGDDAATVLRRLAAGCMALGARWTFLADQSEEQPMVEAEATVRAWAHAARARGELHPELPTEWVVASINALAKAASERLQAGTATETQVAGWLGETWVAAFVAPQPG